MKRGSVRRRARVAGRFLALAGILCAGSVGASANPQEAEAQAPPLHPEGYRIVEAPTLPDRLIEIRSDTAFSLHIERDVADEEHRRMVHLAERLVPTTERMDEILKAGQDAQAARQNWLDRLQEARDAEAEHGPRWWWVVWDDALLPIAVGAPAVNYYVDLFRSRSMARNSLGPDGHRGHFRYSARVETTEEGGGGEARWVVVLELRFDYMCGFLCALHFSHDRRVYFNAAGIPLRVEGDRIPEPVVS